MLFEHLHLDTRPREQHAKHEPRRATACNQALRLVHRFHQSLYGLPKSG